MAHFRKLPRFSTLLARYPNKHSINTKDLFDSIGGQVRRDLDDSVNTCAIRISKALNDGGDPIRRMPSLYELAGVAPKVPLHMPRPHTPVFIVRVMDMKKYLETQYGPGLPIYDATKDAKSLVNLKEKTQGIVLFVWSGPYADFGAFGHVDLFTLWPNAASPPRLEPACEGACYWWTVGGPMRAYLWKMDP